jgi:hypothetical protein
MMSGLGFNAFKEKRYRIGSNGRTFYLWEDPKARELFDTLGFKMCDFSTSVSKTGSGEIWMSYVLDKAPVK